jgi:hypothetical protein
MKEMGSLRRITANKRVQATLWFASLTTVIFLALFFTVLTGWTVDRAEYRLMIRTKGHINELVVTDWIRYFNASTANITAPQGVNVETRVQIDNNQSVIEIAFTNFGGEVATVALSDMKPLSHIPLSSIPTNEISRTFHDWHPAINGDSRNCTDLFSHLSISANTNLGNIDTNTRSVEAIVTDGVPKWTAWPESKEKSFTEALWACLFLSATIGSVCVTGGSLLLNKKAYQIFPTVTLAFASVMCFIYLFIGVGNDVVARTDASVQYRVLLALLSCFFHINYEHLMGNILYAFLIGGSLIEIWLLKIYSLRRYLLYVLPLPFSVLFSFFGLFSSTSLSVGVGASFWNIGIALGLLLTTIRERDKLLNANPIRSLIAPLLVGYLSISATWNYVAGFLASTSDETRQLSIGHIFFALLYVVVLLVTFVLLGKISSGNGLHAKNGTKEQRMEGFNETAVFIKGVLVELGNWGKRYRGDFIAGEIAFLVPFLITWAIKGFYDVVTLTSLFGLVTLLCPIVLSLESLSCSLTGSWRKSRFRYPIRIGILNGYLAAEGVGKLPNSPYTEYSPSDWFGVFSESAEFDVDWITTTQISKEYRIIINPFGEEYPEIDKPNLTTLQRIAGFVEDGGVFVNVAGLAFTYVWDGKGEDISGPLHETYQVDKIPGVLLPTVLLRTTHLMDSSLYRLFGVRTTFFDATVLPVRSVPDKYFAELDKVGGTLNVNEFRSAYRSESRKAVLIPLLSAEHIVPETPSRQIPFECYPIAAIKHGKGYLILNGMKLEKARPHDFEKAVEAIRCVAKKLGSEGTLRFDA